MFVSKILTTKTSRFAEQEKTYNPDFKVQEIRLYTWWIWKITLIMTLNHIQRDAFVQKKT